jgi:hydroxymethylpyrimidine pyrophosphatase-like HAD family hydrolase
MKKLLIAFDVDDTLTDGDKPRKDIINILLALHKSKQVDLMIWSGGGQSYARMWRDRLKLPEDIPCFAKTNLIRPDIAFDDGPEFNMADKIIHV